MSSNQKAIGVTTLLHVPFHAIANQPVDSFVWVPFPRELGDGGRASSDFGAEEWSDSWRGLGVRIKCYDTQQGKWSKATWKVPDESAAQLP